MKSNTVMMAVLLGMSSFMLGTVIGLRISAAHSTAPAANSPAAVSPSQTTAQQPTNLPDNRDEFDCVDLPRDHPLRAKLNGKRLPLNYAGLEKNQKRQMLKDAKVKPLSQGRWLAALDNTLYMLDARWHIRWQHKIFPPIIDFVVVESTGLVYGIAGDNVFFILEAATGKKLYSESHNGSAFYAQVVPFGRDGCLIIEDMTEYRVDAWLTSQSGLNKFGIPSDMWDSLIAYRGTKWLGAVNFPPDAELLVKGNDLYAVTKTDASIYLRKLHISQLKKH